VGHPQIINTTPFAFEPLFVADEDLRPIVVTLFKGTFNFDMRGEVTVADVQIPVNVSGERWTEDPLSSYKFEPETAFCKPSTDVVLVGHARPPSSRLAQIDVGIRVGPVQKLAKVFGDRQWVATGQGIVMSNAAPLERIPLQWERAFGGRDAARSTAASDFRELRNPIGTGFATSLGVEGDRQQLPNIEDPNNLIVKYGDVVPPCGFGFTSPDWQPRASFAGTYDARWDQTRKPMLPLDFDRRFLNAAAPGLIAPGYLRGDEEVVVLNAAAVPRLAFRLPAVLPPSSRLVRRNGQQTTLPTQLDTIIVNTDKQELILLWRAHAAGGPHDFSAISATSPA
jgi:hypothetical protein